MSLMAQETASNPTVELIPIAQAALNEVPEYVQHIASTMATSGVSLRAGNDSDGLTVFARGAADLALFFELIERLAAVSAPRPKIATTAFTSGLADSVRVLHDALGRHDLVALSDGIESRLIPVLLGWNAVDEELRAGLAARA